MLYAYLCVYYRDRNWSVLTLFLLGFTLQRSNSEHQSRLIMSVGIVWVLCMRDTMDYWYTQVMHALCMLMYVIINDSPDLCCYHKSLWVSQSLCHYSDLEVSLSPFDAALCKPISIAAESVDAHTDGSHSLSLSIFYPRTQWQNENTGFSVLFNSISPPLSQRLSSWQLREWMLYYALGSVLCSTAGWFPPHYARIVFLGPLIW